MKRILLIISFFACFAIAGSSQGLKQDLNRDNSVLKAGNANSRSGSRIEVLKIAFLTKRLDLSTEEAQRFWPVYNQYINEIRDIRIAKRDNHSSELETEEKLLKVRKKYNNEFTKALNAEKANTFFMAEKDFGASVQKELNERKEARKNRKEK